MSNASTAGLPPPSSHEANALNEKMQTRKNPTGETEPSSSGVTPPTDPKSTAAPHSSDVAKASNHAVHTRKAQREDTEPSRSGVTPSMDNASTATSSSAQNSKTRRATKRRSCGTNRQNTDAAAPSGKSRKTEHESEDTVTGANAFTVTRKKETVSGAILSAGDPGQVHPFKPPTPSRLP